MKVFTGRRAILKINGQTISYFKSEDFSDRWANKYAIKAERLTDKMKEPTKAYGAVFRLYVLLDKLNVNCYC